jgi:hypothetical protein
MLDPSKVTPAELGAYMTGAHAHEQSQETISGTSS